MQTAGRASLFLTFICDASVGCYSTTVFVHIQGYTPAIGNLLKKVARIGLLCTSLQYRTFSSRKSCVVACEPDEECINTKRRKNWTIGHAKKNPRQR